MPLIAFRLAHRGAWRTMQPQPRKRYAQAELRARAACRSVEYKRASRRKPFCLRGSRMPLLAVMSYPAECGIDSPSHCTLMQRFAQERRRNGLVGGPSQLSKTSIAAAVTCRAWFERRRHPTRPARRRSGRAIRRRNQCGGMTLGNHGVVLILGSSFCA